VHVIQLVYKPPPHKSKEEGREVRRHSNSDSQLQIAWPVPLCGMCYTILLHYYHLEYIQSFIGTLQDQSLRNSTRQVAQ